MRPASATGGNLKKKLLTGFSMAANAPRAHDTGARYPDAESRAPGPVAGDSLATEATKCASSAAASAQPAPDKPLHDGAPRAGQDLAGPMRGGPGHGIPQSSKKTSIPHADIVKEANLVAQ